MTAPDGDGVFRHMRLGGISYSNIPTGNGFSSIGFENGNQRKRKWDVSQVPKE